MPKSRQLATWGVNADQRGAADQASRLSTDELRVRTGSAGICRYGETDEWFPAEPESARARELYEQGARQRCADCLALGECLELALRYEAQPKSQAHGIWGGTAPWERAAILRSRAAGRDLVAVAS